MWVSFARMKGRSYNNNINNNQGFLVKMKNINNNYYYFVSEHVHSLLACYSQSFIYSFCGFSVQCPRLCDHWPEKII